MKREELIAYDKWLTRRKWGTGEIISPEKAADLYLAEHPLPPAEGAEEMFEEVDFVRLLVDNTNGRLSDFDFRRVVNQRAVEFAALHAQKIAEGAEEIIDDAETILHSHPYLKVWTETLFDSEMKVCSIEQALWAIEKAATLHAQKIADKMASERLREELIAYTKAKWTYDPDMPTEIVDEYLKSREK